MVDIKERKRKEKGGLSLGIFPTRDKEGIFLLLSKSSHSMSLDDNLSQVVEFVIA